MYFGSNLQYLRKNNGGMTQEKLAWQMGVSRQTVSKWESGEAIPEVAKLLDLCDIFQCRLDELLRQDMAARVSIYDSVRVLQVKGFRRAQYTMLSPNAQQDVTAYMDAWAERNGLSGLPKIDWSFPQVTAEQKNRFGLQGHVCAVVLPEDVSIPEDGPELVSQETAEYAVVTIRDPFAPGSDRISQAHHQIFQYLNLKGYKKKHSEKILPCFRRICLQEGIPCMELFIHCDSDGNSRETIELK